MSCLEISVIPQFSGTCSFNAILMSSFYSQLLRKLMINKISKTWVDKKNDSLFKFFKVILKNSYDTRDKKIIKLFNKIKPEELIFHLLNKNNINVLNTIIEQKSSGWWYSNYIYEFLKYLNVNVLYLNYMRNHKIIANFDIRILRLKKQFLSFTDDKYQDKYYEISKAIKEPDVIILEHYKLFDNSDLMYLHQVISEKNTLNLVYDVNSTFDLKNEVFKDLIDLKEEIEFRGNKYKLDSILLNDYESHHVIVGITCNNEKYVYNGWNKDTTDVSFVSDKKEVLQEPCKLMKFDWNIHNDSEFCLNVSECKLDKITDRKNLCFSFNKGDRKLVYVKVSKKSSSSSSSLLSSLPSSFKSFSPKAKEGLKITLKDMIDNIDEIEIDNRLSKINHNNIKLPLVLKRKIVLYKIYDEYKIRHEHINVDIINYVHSEYDINKLFEKGKLRLGHFYLPDEINKDIFRLNLYKHFQLDFSNYHENIDDIIKTKLKLTPITDMSKYDSIKVINIDGKDYNIQTLFYYHFIIHLDTTHDDIINNRIENIKNLKKIYKSQITLDEIIYSYEEIIDKLKNIYKFNKNIDKIIDYKLIIKLFGIKFMSLYLTTENKPLEELIKLLNDSDKSTKKIFINSFNLLKLLSNNISNIEELIEFLNKEFGKKTGGKNNKTTT
jgi:hypothetical protein